MKGVKIYDMFGNLLKVESNSYNKSSYQLDVTNIPNGVLIVKIELLNNEFVIKKIIK